MRVVLAGNKERGATALRALLAAGHEVQLVLVHPPGGGLLADAASEAGLAVEAVEDVNAPDSVARLRALQPDALILAGYSQIVSQEVIDAGRLGCINLHGGKLPEYRGSSPLNWALIRGETSFTLSVIQVDNGVDTGPVLAERAFPIGPDDTIADLHDQARAAFPELLLGALAGLESGAGSGRVQDEAAARYFPLRFPDDGLVLFDLHTAAEVHDRIRALAEPYPGAFTFHAGRRITLRHSRLADRVVLGEPGRVYAAGAEGILVAATDRCLWIDRAETPEGADALGAVRRYDMLATVRAAVAATLEKE